jgi:hypothetical protein
MSGKNLAGVMVCVALLFSSAVTGCAPGRAGFISLKSCDEMCTTLACFMQRLRVLPDRAAIDAEGVETFAWDTDVRHVRRMNKDEGDAYWYQGYYLDCTYEASFDKDGNKLGSEWFGTGCFDSRGNLYREGSFFYNE